MKNGTYNYGSTPLETITAALNDEPYWMVLTGKDAEVIVAVVNQGIDSHLEAFTESTFKWHNDRFGRKLEYELPQATALRFPHSTTVAYLC